MDIYTSLVVPHFRFVDELMVSDTYFDAPITSVTHVHPVFGLSADEEHLPLPR